ncbi:Proteasome subunit beta type-1 [Geranomyces michiganensis]|nr:Proteasome subunit beta type-1 [Geranomyces michiganensis]
MHRRSSRHVIDVDQEEVPRPLPGRLVIRGQTQYDVARNSMHSVDSDQSRFVLASTTIGTEIPTSALPPLPKSYSLEPGSVDAIDDPVTQGDDADAASSYSSVGTGHRFNEPGIYVQKTTPRTHDRKLVVKKFRKRVIKSTATAGLKSVKAAGSILNDFRRFALRSNVVDLALGVIIGGAFTAIVTSVVNDLLGPLFGAALGSQLQNAFVLLKSPDAAACNVTDCSALKTPSQVYAAGGVTWNYGMFFQTMYVPNLRLTKKNFRLERPPKKTSAIDFSMHMYEEQKSSCPVKVPVECRFSPYTDNGGTTLAIAGDDFCVIAGDTRQSEGYSINSRYAPKVYQLSNGSVLATGGMYADGVTLVKMIEQRLEWYRHAHDKQMSSGALAQMLSTILYHKRMFPYYVWNTLGGLDEDGKGAVYSYDPVGNYEKHKWNCSGSAGHLIQPFLDNQIGFTHQKEKAPLTLERVVQVTKDAFTSATERDIYTGDYLEMFLVTANGIEKTRVDLKKD